MKKSNTALFQHTKNAKSMNKPSVISSQIFKTYLKPFPRCKTRQTAATTKTVEMISAATLPGSMKNSTFTKGDNQIKKSPSNEKLDVKLISSKKS